MAYLTAAPISWEHVADLHRWVLHGGCGAVVTFIGVVRADQDGDRLVSALCYEAYPEMAEPLLHRLVSEAQARWSLQGAQVQHRLGRVEVGQISLAVVVAAPHRAQAYAASRFLVEQIKHEVPVWKREQYNDGTSQWISGAPARLDLAPARPEVCGAVGDPSGADHADV